MKNGKYSKRRGVASKTLVLALAVMLIVGATVGGTIAWLTSSTGSVVNTFTAAAIEVTLVETKGLTNGKWENPMIPGASYEKDPTVTVTDKTTTDCYLFVKFEENAAAKKYLTYTSTLNTDNGWALVDGTTDVWYRIVRTGDETKAWTLLAADETGKAVTVNGETVTKQTMTEAAGAKLAYTAYAVQLAKSSTKNFTPAEAWAKVAP